jgi:hypothetical protein
VRRVRHEGAHPLLGREGSGLGRLEVVEHLVEGGRGAAQLGGGARGAQPPAAVAPGDGAGDRRHPLEGAERRAHHHDERAGREEEERGRGAEQDRVQRREGRPDRARVGGQHQLGAVAERRGEGDEVVVGGDGGGGHGDRGGGRVGRAGRGRRRGGSGTGAGGEAAPRSAAQLLRARTRDDRLALGARDQHRDALRREAGGEVVVVDRADQGGRGRGAIGQPLLDLRAEAVAEDDLHRHRERQQQHREQGQHGDDCPQAERSGAQRGGAHASTR